MKHVFPKYVRYLSVLLVFSAIFAVGALIYRVATAQQAVFVWNNFALLPLLALLVNIVIIAILYIQTHRHLEVMTLAFYLGASLIVSLADFFQHLSANQTAFAYAHYLGAFGWIFSVVTLLIFAITFTKRQVILTSVTVLSFLITPVIAFLWLILTTDWIIVSPLHQVMHKPWGFDAVPGPYVWVLMIWIILSVVLTLALLIIDYFQAQSKLRKKQLKLVTLAVALPSFAGIFFDGILNVLGFNLPRISVPFTALGALVIFYTMYKKHLFVLTPSLISESLFNVMAEGVVVLNNNNEVEFVNRRVQDLFAVSPQDVLQKPIDNLFVDFNSNTKLKQCIASETRNLKTVLYQLPNSDKNTTLRITCQPIFSEQGTLIEGKLAVMSDITALKEKSDSLAVALGEAYTLGESLRQERDQSKAILQSMGESLLVMDKDLRVVLMNKAAEHTFEISLKQAKGKHLSQIYHIWQAGHPLPIDQWGSYEALTTKKVVIKSIDSNLVWVTPTGKRYFFSQVVSPLISNRKVLGVVAVMRDAADDRALNEARKDFISIATHQLRTPLSAIRWMIELFKEESYEDLPDTSQSYIDDIYDSSNRLNRLVNALLNVSRVESNRLSVKPVATDLVALVQKTIKDLILEAKGKHCEVKFIKPHKKIANIKLDKSIISQVFYNLIANAIRYSSGRCNVEIHLMDQDKSILFTVKDYGIGIPQAAQSKIYQKFFRADNARRVQTEGSGLGLYIVKNIVESIGGKIWFESAENKGTTFFVEIPKTGMREKAGPVTLIEGKMTQ